jgi:LacI family repressor for deo operon, udp, cdd, tsx, nupC, and nupG
MKRFTETGKSKRRKRPTIQEVAELAQVSTATVSRVLNTPVLHDDKTRQRVEAAVEQLGYVPNHLGVSLRRLSTKVLLVVVPGFDLQNTFFADVIRWIQVEAESRGYAVFIADTAHTTQAERRVLDMLKHRLVDGAVFFTPRTKSEELLKISGDVPVVVACETLEPGRVAQVGIDNFRAAYDATRYLIASGHRRIAHVAGAPAMRLAVAREQGYRRALEEQGLTPVVVAGDFTVESGRLAARRLLDGQADVTAVFCANDASAFGVLAELHRAGIAVPEAMSVMGFDDIPMSRYVVPTLSTVAQPQEAIGRTAAGLLFAEMEGHGAADTRPSVVVPHQVVLRESTGPAPPLRDTLRGATADPG